MRTVIHLVSNDKEEQQTALAIARNLLNDETGSIDTIAVVVQAGGIHSIVTGADTEDRVRTLLDDDVSFKACSNTLESNDLEKSDLVDGIETVPEGAVEVTRLQTEGYAYIRP